MEKGKFLTNFHLGVTGNYYFDLHIYMIQANQNFRPQTMCPCVENRHTFVDELIVRRRNQMEFHRRDRFIGPLGT